MLCSSLESQRWAPDYYNYLEFIPYDHFENIKFIEEGGFREIPKATWFDGVKIANGFGEISKATWNDGVRIVKKEKGTWKKARSGPCTILLKEIKESENIDQDYIKELKAYITFHRCNNEFNAPSWCNSCDRKELVDKFDTWSSGNDNIDLLIQISQRMAPNYENYLEFIPYDHFKEIKFITKHGFGEISKAIWIDGIRITKKEKFLMRLPLVKKKNYDSWIKSRKCPNVIALKEIKKSENINQDYIKEVLSFIYIDENLPNFGLCPSCDDGYNAPAWCDTCDQKALINKFNTWKARNENEVNNSKEIDYEYMNELKVNIELHRSDNWIVCRYYGITQNPITENYILVMEYLPKGDIKKEIFNQGKDRLKWQKKLQYLYLICNGIRGIHELNYIHGDIHSGNILLKYTSDICITDLGLSRPANSKEASQKQVNPSYSAPEILLNKSPKSKASDIFAIGILMVEFASNKRAFENYNNSNDITIEITKDDFERPELPPNTPNCYVELIEKCLDKDPNQRPSAEELVKSISGWLKYDWKSKSNSFNIADKQWKCNESKE
ncbi:4381_t:CDS:2 [Funneliformis geosporum]|nr:4381_t:CDS:2 [Funneliformis geosporum]